MARSALKTWNGRREWFEAHPWALFGVNWAIMTLVWFASNRWLFRDDTTFLRSFIMGGILATVTHVAGRSSRRQTKVAAQEDEPSR